MATYNGERYLKQQLKSILDQLSSRDEIIISDDGSTDNTLAVIKTFKDKRIRLLHSDAKNVIRNFENALLNTKGDIIILSDQDDIWKADKVQNLVVALEECTCVFSNAIVFEKTPHESVHLLYSKGIHTGFWNNLVKNKYIGATMAFKASLLDLALPFPKKVPMHDMWIGLLAEISGKTKFIDEPLIYYRRHGENVSTTGKKSTNSIFKMLMIRLTIMRLLVQRLFLNFVNNLKTK